MANTTSAARKKRNSSKTFLFHVSDSLECTSGEHSFGSMASKYFLFRSFGFSFGFLHNFLCAFFLPKISAMVTSAVNITKPLQRIYCRRRRHSCCCRIYFFFNWFAKKFREHFLFTEKIARKHFALVFNYFTFLFSSLEHQVAATGNVIRAVLSLCDAIHWRKRLNKSSK